MISSKFSPITRKLPLCAGITLIALITGCVSSGTFEKKASEADALGKELTTVRDEQASLLGKNRALEARQTVLSGEMAALAERNRKLETEKKELEETLKAKEDALSQSLFGLRQQVTELTGANDSLKKEILGLVKSHDDGVRRTSASFEELLSLMRDEVAKGEVSVAELKGTLTVTLFEPVLFEQGKTALKPSSGTTLEKLATYLKGAGSSRAIRVEAFTETMLSPSWSLKQYPTGWEFAAARAVAVVRSLQENGVSPLNLSAVSYGEYLPLSDNITELGMARNRRIQITIPPK